MIGKKRENGWAAGQCFLYLMFDNIVLAAFKKG